MSAFSSDSKKLSTDFGWQTRLLQGPTGAQTMLAIRNPEQTEGYMRSLYDFASMLQPGINDMKQSMFTTANGVASSASDPASINVLERGSQQKYIDSMIGMSNTTKQSLWTGALNALKSLSSEAPTQNMTYNPGDTMQKYAGDTVSGLGFGYAGMMGGQGKV
jgi:hypothetical protein